MKRILLATLLLGCGRSDIYRPRVLPAVDPCVELGLTRPCSSSCGPGTELCVKGFWSKCDAPAQLDPPSRITIEGTIRDFKQLHPDFEHLVGDDPGIVGNVLGPDRVPTYPHAGATKTITSPQTFAQWFHDVPGINQSTPASLVLERTSQSPLLYSFSDDTFFPIDNRLFGNEGNAHNFHFTLELHTELEYRGGETLFFRGDDDLWVFVNDKLVIDLGGPHPTEDSSVALDTLGLTLGSVVPLDVFFAERHRNSSTLRVDTTNAHFLRCPQ